MTTSDDLLSWFTARIAEETQVSPDSIDPDKPLYTLGIDSATLLTLAFAVEETFGSELNPADLFAAASLRSFCETFQEQLETKQR